MSLANTYKQLTAASGLFFGIFLTLHLLCHYTLNLGYDVANENLTIVRKIYRNPLFEIVLVVSLLTHMCSNTMLYLHRTKIEKHAQGKKDDDHPHPSPQGHAELIAHRIAGYVLVLLIFGHVYATRIAPLLFMDDPSLYDYSFAAAPYNLLPMKLFPTYYIVLGMAGGWHLIYGSRSAASILSGTSVTGKPFPMPLKFLALASHIAIIGAVIALGKVATSPIMSEKEDLRKDLGEKMGIPLH